MLLSCNEDLLLCVLVLIIIYYVQDLLYILACYNFLPITIVIHIPVEWWREEVLVRNLMSRCSLFTLILNQVVEISKISISVRFLQAGVPKPAVLLNRLCYRFLRRMYYLFDLVAQLSKLICRSKSDNPVTRLL